MMGVVKFIDRCILVFELIFLVWFVYNFVFSYSEISIFLNLWFCYNVIKWLIYVNYDLIFDVYFFFVICE